MKMLTDARKMFPTTSGSKPVETSLGPIMQTELPPWSFLGIPSLPSSSLVNDNEGFSDDEESGKDLWNSLLGDLDSGYGSQSEMDSTRGPFSTEEGKSHPFLSNFDSGDDDSLLDNPKGSHTMYQIREAVLTCVRFGIVSSELGTESRSSILVSTEIKKATFKFQGTFREFMREQYGDSSKTSLGSVITLSGSALCAQAVTCREYLQSNWP